MRALLLTPAVLLFLSQPALPRQGGDPARGKAVFGSQCAGCHATTGEKRMGPGLKGVFHAKKLVNGKPSSERNVLEIIDKGAHGMPPYADKLTPEQKADLIAYLRSL